MARMPGRLKRSKPETQAQAPAERAVPQRTARILPVNPPQEPPSPGDDRDGGQSKEEVTMAEKDDTTAQVEEQESSEERTDASGRVLHPWEVAPEEQAHAIPLVEEGREGSEAADALDVEQEKAGNSTQHGEAGV